MGQEYIYLIFDRSFHETPIRITNVNLLTSNQMKATEFFDIIPFGQYADNYVYIISGNAPEHNILGWVLDILKEEQHAGYNIKIIKSNEFNNMQYHSEQVDLYEYSKVSLKPNILYVPNKIVEQAIFNFNKKTNRWV
jgi:hypothetical protein